MKTITSLWRWCGGFCAVLTVLVSGMLLREYYFSPAPSPKNAQLLPVPRPLISLTLKGIGGPVDLLQMHGNWLLVFMGYTYCPDVCPLELQKLAQMLDSFSAAKEPAPVVVFVSVDPERDTVEKLAAYTAYFHSAIRGVTGNNAGLAKLASFFGAAYNRRVTIDGKEYLVEAGADMPAGAGENYGVNHSSRVFIVNPAGEYIGSFSPPYDAETLYTDMRVLMKDK